MSYPKHGYKLPFPDPLTLPRIRQALWQIQIALQTAAGATVKDVLALDAEWVQLNNVECASLDVVYFEHAVDACQGTQGVNLSDTQREALERAVRLYHGDLLEGWYQDWCLFERERLQNCYLTALDKLVAYCDAHGYVDCGLGHAERILRCDPAEEQTHYHMMHLHWTAGHRTRAMRQYRRCEKNLVQELGFSLPSERRSSMIEFGRTSSTLCQVMNLPCGPAHHRWIPSDLLGSCRT